jgi:hypothetical protein
VTWVFYQQDFEDIIDKELLINGWLMVDLL